MRLFVLTPALGVLIYTQTRQKRISGQIFLPAPPFLVHFYTPQAPSHSPH